MNFKNLESDDILISPFQVHKTFTVNNNDSGSGVYSIPLTKGSDSNLYDWSISVVVNWSISNSNYCDESPCANIYFPNEQSGEDAVLSRTISVEEVAILSMYLYGYWDFNVQIILY